MSSSHFHKSVLALSAAAALSTGFADEPLIPASSDISRAPATLHRELISAVEAGEPYKLDGAAVHDGVSRRSAQTPKVGACAIEFVARAEGAGSKISGIVPGAIPASASRVGIWIYRDKTSNIGECGFALTDAEGESFVSPVATTEVGWQWIEADLAGSEIKVSGAAKDKNGKLDQPLRGAGVYGLAAGPGEIVLPIDGLVSLGPVETMSELQVRLYAGSALEPGGKLRSFLVLTNRTDAPIEIKMDYLAQRDSALTQIKKEGQELETMPVLGKEIDRKALTQSVSPRSFMVLEVSGDLPYQTGSYLVSVSYESPLGRGIEAGHVFVLPEGKLTPGFHSRFGVNVNNPRDIDKIKQLGMGWVRFENLKWPMMSKQPGVYAFDGSVGPVSSDSILRKYQEAGIEVLPFLFETAKYASPAPDKPNRGRYAPNDNSLYAQFCYQVAARYGSTKHPASDLLTPDKASAWGALKVVELWNEPNLQDPGWGHWVGTTPQYLEMMRAGAEAVKKADPKMIISPGGWAGIDLDYVAELGSYTYKDGKHPIDFVDLINVHHYTGQSAPELARVNTNIERGKAIDGKLFEERLAELVEWRDGVAPGKQIWMTETGFDTGGPRWVTRRDQAAFSARNLIMILAAGVDKVFIYRITGDSPGLYAASGLLAAGDGYKPSFFSVATLIRLVDSFDSVVQLPTPDPGIRLYLFERQGVRTLAAWSLKPEGVLGLQLGKVTVVDSFGYRESREVAADQALGDFPTYFTDLGASPEIDALVKRAEKTKLDRKAELARLTKLGSYLFDFGSMTKVGGETFGVYRRFLPVVAGDHFDPKKGFGFDPAAKVSDLDAHWIKDLLSRDSCRVQGGGSFIFEVKPGDYNFAMRGVPLTNKTPSKVFIESGGRSELFEFWKGAENLERVMRLDGTVTVRAEHTTDFSWIKVRQVE